jgi:hypothetical protein
VELEFISVEVLGVYLYWALFGGFAVAVAAVYGELTVFIFLLTLRTSFFSFFLLRGAYPP